MWWPPYRKRVMAEADELMEYYGDQALNAAARISLTAHQSSDYRKAHFYRRVERYLERFIDADARRVANIDVRKQEQYAADVARTAMFDRVIGNKTLH